MNVVPCICGADLATAPPHAVWLQAGVAIEMRTCVSCKSTRAYRRVDTLRSSLVRLEGEKAYGWANLTEAMDALLTVSLDAVWDGLLPDGELDKRRQDWRPTKPAGTRLLGAAGVPVAIVVPAGYWYVLSPEEDGQ